METVNKVRSIQERENVEIKQMHPNVWWVHIQSLFFLSNFGQAVQSFKMLEKIIIG